MLVKIQLAIAKIAILVLKVRALSPLRRIKELGFVNVNIGISTFQVVKCQPHPFLRLCHLQIVESIDAMKSLNVASTEFAEEKRRPCAI